MNIPEMTDAKQVPLIELLRGVPATARLQIDDGEFSTQYIPVGRYCQEAAAILAARDAQYAAQGQEPDGRPALQLADLILSMDMATEKGQRARELARQVQEHYDESPAELALREIASYLSVGGYNSPWVDADKYKAKIIEEIQALSDPAAQERAEPVAPAVGEIKPADLTIEMWPPRPTSGMIVGMSKGVKITHKPTGLYVTCDSERNQHANRDKAYEQLCIVLSATPPAPAQPDQKPDFLQMIEECKADPLVIVKRSQVAQPSPEPSKPEQAEAPSAREIHSNRAAYDAGYEDALQAAGISVLIGEHHNATLPPAIAAGELPPMPEHKGVIYLGEQQLPNRAFTVDQMKAYARAALATKPQAEQEAAAKLQRAIDHAMSDFELTKSIIHECPALRLPQSFVERLGMTAQIVALKGASPEVAQFIVDACNAAMPGEVCPHCNRPATTLFHAVHEDVVIAHCGCFYAGPSTTGDQS